MTMRNSFIPYEVGLRLHTESIETIINALLEKQETLYSQALSATDDFEKERCFDDLADWNYELIKLAELLLVDISHWVEREMKRLVAALPDKFSTKKISSMDYMKSRNLFSDKTGVDLEKIPGDFELYVLRLFANCWKHNANPKPSEKLCKDLNINTDPALIVGLLTSKEVSKSLGSLLNLTEENSKHYEINIVRAYAMCAYNYLTTLEQKLN
ncbi:hypothetical protein [Nostoc sp. FACHB-133]|uniref:hypothetical protein n=1 Tax=Nostoc sp. FACHB-133 TaxID=2692835 RepID=UPI001685929A|nr:hypothetical protein [Nostoc sp. FACHB-133]MBD2527299.1 hypothetical protein [Nostoc sp. FACHB-133]